MVLENAFRTHIKNEQNTDMMSFGGKVLALFETGLRYTMDQLILETVGIYDMSGSLPKDTFQYCQAMYTIVLRRCGAYCPSKTLS